MTSSLVIIGAVARPLELDFDALEILAASLPSQMVRLAAGRDVPALRLDALLARACISKHVRSLVAESEDGRKILSLPPTAIKMGLILYRVGRQPLPRGLGGPVRLIVPRYGEVKALASLHVSDGIVRHDDDITTRFGLTP